jgi:hypothetical protein
MIAALAGHNKTALKDKWQFRLVFEQRCDIFLEEMAKIFPSGNANAYLAQIIADGKTLQPDRNLLVHGSINADARVHNNGGATPIEVEHTLIASGFQKGQPVERRFSLEELKTLFYGLGHLAGRLNSFSPRNDGRPPTLPGASADEMKLIQEMLRQYHPAHLAQQALDEKAAQP